MPASEIISLAEQLGLDFDYLSKTCAEINEHLEDKARMQAEKAARAKANRRIATK